MLPAECGRVTYNERVSCFYFFSEWLRHQIDPYCCPLVAGQYLVVLPSRGLHIYQGGTEQSPLGSPLLGYMDLNVTFFPHSSPLSMRNP